jgi:tetratricopeptide (TPR) repeat protein
MMAWLWPAVLVSAGLWLLAPTAAWLDSGELAGAAVTLGVPHPTGFPTFLLGGHTLARLPLASSALRVHLLGLLAGVAAVGLWWRALQHKPGQKWQPSVLLLPAALLLPAVALHLRSAEVYPLVWLLVGAALFAFVHGGPRRLMVLGLCSGLAVATHAEAALLTGVLTLAALGDARRAPRKLLAAMVLGLLGALTLVALPLAGNRQPWLQWDEVQTSAGLWRHLTAASIRAAFGAEMGSTHAVAGVQALVTLVWQQGALWLLPACLGAAVMVRDGRRALVVATGLVVVVDAAYAALINPMGLRDQQAGQIVLLGLTLLGAEGVAAAAQVLWQWATPATQSQGNVVTVAAVSVAVAGLAGGELLRVQPQLDLRAAPAFFDASWRQTPPGALLIAASDHQASQCVWQQAAEGIRPDCRCVPGVFLRARPTLAALASQTDRPGLQAAALATQQPGTTSADILAAWLRPSLAAGPVMWEAGLAQEDTQVLRHVQPSLRWGQVLQDGPAPAVRSTAALALADAATATCAALGGDPSCRETPMLGQLLASRLGLQAVTWLQQEPALALRLLTAAVSLDPRSPKLANNLALVLLQKGNAREALRLATVAIATDPTYRRAHRTAARAAVRLGDVAQALYHAEQAIVGAPSRGEARLWLTQLLQEAPAPLRPQLEQLLPGGP